MNSSFCIAPTLAASSPEIGLGLRRLARGNQVKIRIRLLRASYARKRDSSFLWTRIEPLDDDVALYVTQASTDVEVVLDPEHDAFRWLPLEEAAAHCLPIRVADGLRHAASFLT